MDTLPIQPSAAGDPTHSNSTSAIPSWSQAEIESSQAPQRPIAPNEHGKVFSWAEVRDIVETNNLQLIRRKPSQRLVYKAWCKDIIAAYGSITAYMCTERLRWTPQPNSSADTGPMFNYQDPTPFTQSSDFKILRNDWPYGSFEPGITHLIVWSKPRIPTDPESGPVTPESRQLIDRFIERTFVERMEREGISAGERVLWFKNWGALQSVRGLEHIHVLLKDVPGILVDELTGEKGAQP